MKKPNNHDDEPNNHDEPYPNNTPHVVFRAGGDIRNVQAGDDNVMNIGKSSAIKPEIRLAVTIGVGLIAIVILLAVFIPNPTPFRYIIFRSIMPLAAGLIVGLLPGMLQVKVAPEGMAKAIGIRATSGFGVFVLMYMLNPAGPAYTGMWQATPISSSKNLPPSHPVSSQPPPGRVRTALLTANPRVTLDGEPNASLQEIRFAAERTLASRLNAAYALKPSMTAGDATVSGVLVRGGGGYPADIHVIGTVDNDQAELLRSVFGGIRFPEPNDQGITDRSDTYFVKVRVIISAVPKA